MSQPSGVKLKADKRRELAAKAIEMKEGGLNYLKIAVALDVSEPTARSLVDYGRRLRDGASWEET